MMQTEIETAEIQSYEINIDSKTLVLVDTPGFDDTRMSDYEILQKLASWLQTVAEEGQLLSGLIYLHRITNTRVEGSARRALHAFQRICGEETYRNVILATTFWNSIEHCKETGEAREQRLLTNEGFWKAMKDKGAKTTRLTRDYKSVIPDLLAISQKPTVTLGLQRELDDGRSLETTMAGLFLTEKSRSLEVEHENKAKQMQEDFVKRLDAQQSRVSAARRLHRKTMLFKEQEHLTAMEKEKQDTEKRLNAIRMDLETKEAELAAKLREEEVLQSERMLERERDEAEEIRAAQEKETQQRLDSSLTQRKKVEQDLDLLRTASVAGLAQILVPGVEAEGVGMVDAEDGTRYSVHRNGLNMWCDSCLAPFGINEHVCKCSRSTRTAIPSSSFLRMTLTAL